MVLIREFPVPTEGIKLQSCGVEALVDNEVHGKGSLFVTEANIAWINSDSGEGFKVAYKKMTLHAISRDPGVHSTACLYIMVNGNVLDEDEDFQVESPADLDEDDGEEQVTEIRFVPENDSALEAMYKAVQECSLLHPDPSSDLSNEEEEQDPDELFEGYNPGVGGNGDAQDGNGDNDEPGEDEDDDEEAERLEQFIKMQLHFQNSRRDREDDDKEGRNGNGRGFQLSFVPQPGQFDDA